MECDTSIRSVPAGANEHHRFVRPVLVATAGMLLVAGCSSSQPLGGAETTAHHAGPSSGHSTSAATHESPDENSCVTPRVPVFPYQHFKRSNREDIARQLMVLHKAHKQDVSITARDIVNAGAIVTDSSTDPVYARAFTYANSHPKQNLTSAALLGKDFSKAKTNCLRPEQLRETDALYRALAKGLEPKVGRQLSALGRVAYTAFATGYKDFKKRYHQELGY